MATWTVLGCWTSRAGPIDEVLASKDKQAQPQFDTSQLDRWRAELGQREQAIAKAVRDTQIAVSQTRFEAKYGEDAYNELERRAVEFAHSGHPVAEQFKQALASSPDHVLTAAQILTELGL